MLHAYSTVVLKAVENETGVFEGIASTPVPDRDLDVMEPAGAEFTLPMPLLWQHKADQPIGHVIAAKTTKDGIRIRAKVATGILPRIDEAWTLIKNGLVTGLSIGARALDFDHLPTGGLHVKRWMWLELSAVTIPANAQASITTIKSLDAPYRAASGTSDTGVRSSSTPGATGRSTTGTAMNISEQLTAAKTALHTKNARLEELNKIEAEDGLTLDAAQEAEAGTLTKDVAVLSAKVHRLTVMEQGQLALAKGVSFAGSIDEGSAQRTNTGGYGHVTVKSTLPPGIEFARYLMCKATSFLSMRDGNFISAIDVAKQRFPDNPRIHMLLKAAVPAATTTHVTWAAPLMDPTNLTSEFIEYLNPMTIIGKMSLRRVPFNVRINGQTSGGDAWWVGEGLPKPLTKFDFDARTLLFNKVATIAVLTQEVVRFSSPSAEALVRDALAKAIVRRIDRTFIDPAAAAVSGVSPASITNGVTPLAPTGTGDADDIRTDIGNLIAEFVQSNQDPTRLVIIMPNTLALAASLMVNALGQREFPDLSMTGGTIMGIPVIASQYAANESGSGNLVVAVNQDEIFLADDGGVNIDVSDQASLQMLDNPTNASSTGTATQMVSLWQTNSIGLRAERFITWLKARTTAVSFIDDANWGSVGSPG